jgi:ABC transport system ATP-binding/permease protein
MQLEDNKTVLEQVADGGETVIFGDERLSARGYLRRFLFEDDRANEPISKLSGGERARLMLAKVLKRGGNVLVLDEPTNDLDLPSLRMLEEAVVDFQGSVLAVSHDRYFLDRICDQIIAFEDGGVFVQPGNYSYYLEKKLEREQRFKEPKWEAPRREPVNKKEPVVSTSAPKTTRPRKLNFKEQRELEGMEAAILALETQVQELEATLNDPSFYATRAAEAPQVLARLETARQEVARLYARWAELEAIPQ